MKSEGRVGAPNVAAVTDVATEERGVVAVADAVVGFEVDGRVIEVNN